MGGDTIETAYLRLSNGCRAYHEYKPIQDISF